MFYYFFSPSNNFIGVISELITELGVRGVQVDELYGLDEVALQSLK